MNDNDILIKNEDYIYHYTKATTGFFVYKKSRWAYWTDTDYFRLTNKKAF